MKNIKDIIKHEIYEKLRQSEKSHGKYTKTLYKITHNATTGRRYRLTAIVYKGQYRLVLDNIDKYHMTSILMQDEGVIIQRQNIHGEVIEKIYKPISINGWERYKEMLNYIYHYIEQDWAYIGMGFYKSDNIDLPVYQEINAY